MNLNDDLYGSYSEDVRKVTEQRAGHGILLVAASMRLLFQDARAAQLCDEIREFDKDHESGALPLPLLKLCGEIRELLQFRNHQKDWEDFKVKRVIRTAKRHIFVSAVGLPEGIGDNEASILLAVDVMQRRATPSLEQALQRFKLTNREAAVVQNLYKGWTNGQIAKALGVTEQTVKEHMRHIMEKTQTTTRTGILVAFNCST